MDSTHETPASEPVPPEEELTEVDPMPDKEGVSMKVIEKDNNEQAETKIDPHTALMQMPVNDQNSALNCLIGFVGIAQRRGVFALDEAAKAYHCIQMFRPENQHENQ